MTHKHITRATVTVGNVPELCRLVLAKSEHPHCPAAVSHGPKNSHLYGVFPGKPPALGGLELTRAS